MTSIIPFALGLITKCFIVAKCYQIWTMTLNKGIKLPITHKHQSLLIPVKKRTEL